MTTQQLDIGTMVAEDHQTLFELASALLAIFSIDGRFCQLNPAWERLLGYSPEDLIGRHFLEFVHPSDRAATRLEGIRLRRASSELVAFENRYRCRDGSYVWLSWNVTSDLGAGRTYAAAFDVSGRRHVEERLRQTVEMRRSITESSPDHILMLDIDGRILYSNRSLTAGFADSVLGSPIYEHTDAAFHDQMKACFDGVVATGEPDHYDIEETADDGTTAFFSARVGPIRRRGDVVALSVTLTDVTVARRAAAEREQLIRQLEEKNQELERYTYTVSHDLKSPLVTIKGFLGFLEKSVRDGDTGRLQEDIARISGAADRMGDLLDELLELSRVGRVVHPPECFPLGELVRDVMALAIEPSHGRTLEVYIDPDLPRVRGDRVRLFQVFQNLIDNATKFLGDQTMPRIEVSFRMDGEERVFFVRDNGIGIDPRYGERVFGLFDKLDPDSGGTGIGLALVRRIIELHGGRIWVDSDGVGRGATFCFTLSGQP